MSIRIGTRSAALLAAALLAMAACLRGASAFSLSQDVGFVRDQVRGARQPAGLDVSEAEDLPPEQWFTEQIVDHFGDSDETWSQRYFVNDTFFEPYAPSDYGQVVFLCVGGEGPAFQPTVVVTGGPHCAWMIHLAEKFGALVVAVEHRFYGKSMPRPDFSTESLEVHGSRQAQEDLRLFRNHITNVTGGLHESAKWVTFGGSYPGMMAAWARELYPDLFHASVSSSAPVEAVVNMQGYNDVVALSMTVANVGGSLSCLKNIKLAFSNLGYILQSGQPNMIQELANTYNVCSTNTSSITDPMNQKMFLESFWGLFPLQSNDPSCEGEYCNYEKICELFEKPVNPDKSLLALYNALTAGSNECLDISWNEMIESMKSPDNSDRSWFYQTCKEFGFYQTCDPGTFCPFTTSPHVSTVESYLEICEEAFGIDRSSVAASVAASNAFYGGWDYNATNVFFLNGEVDPWHASGVLHTNNDGQRTLMVSGASHHAWTHPVEPTDQQSVVFARRLIESVVKGWITDEPSSSVEV